MFESNLPAVEFDELNSFNNLITSFDSFILVDINFLNNQPIHFPNQKLKRQKRNNNQYNNNARPPKTSNKNRNNTDRGHRHNQSRKQVRRLRLNCIEII